ncbi:alpha/beta hydrolase [Corynebacterium pseudokroppenstedtii]|uniref:alpha/beta hydrolase n=1 Tax=Corynebacterium pseudokroppenstedtii TaxID=2804917 RepID=UPI00254C80D5|nr:alpha/beta hydrolase [Corynebacterium pseudokroppenstedtii]MDK7146638.1 alpha/beta hydrolase [Corynebacterium pseudokroppenstedtii]
MSKDISIKTLNGYDTILSAVINFPPEFDASQTYPAIVVSHPGGGVKEQTAGLYAKKVAEYEFVTVVYDASFQGASSGEPRQLENPHIRTEDVSAVVDYLTTLDYVDNERIGAMGICAGAGYTANAAINDPRIKAVGTVSMVNIGQMFRNGWDGSVTDAEAAPILEQAAQARTTDAAGQDNEFPLAPMNEDDASNEELRQAWEYYHTPRCEHPNAPGWMTTRSLSQIITYDAFHKAETYLAQPLLIVAGSEAGSKWMSDDLYERAASTDKSFHVVEGANHMDLYDGEKEVAEAVSKLGPFFSDKL